MKNKIIGPIIAIVLFTSGVLTGRYYFTKTDIKIIEKVVTKTEYKYKELKIENKPVFDIDNFNRLLYCYNSEFKTKDIVENNWLKINIADECKSIDLKYEIGTKSDFKLYLTIGATAGTIGILSGLAIHHYLK